MQPNSLDIHKQLTTARLPSLPQVLLQLLELCDREDVGIAEIGAVVAKDTAIAARVVNAANSPYYRPSRTLENIDQCLSVLGTGTVRKLALNQSVVELFGRFQSTGEFDLRHFWFHGLSVAVTARELARRLAYENLEEAYLAGLLHDVGQLALLAVAADRYLPMFANFTGEQALMRQEQETFGLTHAEVGAWLAERWNLRGLLVDSILYHHESVARVRDAHRLVQIVMLANLFNCHTCEDARLDENDLSHWELRLDDARALAEAAQNEAREIAAHLGIELPSVTHPGVETAADDAPIRLADAVAQRLDALTTPLETKQARAEDDARGDLLRGAGLLFGTRAAAVLALEKGRLRWRGGDGATTIELDADAADSVLARAGQGEIGVVGENNGRECLADLQILRGLGGERLLCLPLNYQTDRLGVLAIALSGDAAAWFMARKPLLDTFAREAGNRLGQARAQRRQLDTAREDVIENHTLQVRKLVHEAANPLSVVRNYLRLLRDQLAEGDKTRQDIELMESELRRVGRLLREFRPTLADATAAPARARVDVNALIREVAHFSRMGKEAMRGIDLQLDLSEDLPEFVTDGDKLRQILTNLIFNAAEAMTAGGRIVLTSAAWRGARGHDSIELNISDNGPGIPQEVLDHLYQPVQTTKGQAHAGLGLSIVGGLVEEIGGNMQCSSSPVGTRFKILFPMTG